MGSVLGPLRRVWRAFGSVKLAAALLLVLLLVSVVASLFPQIPQDPAARESWLSVASLRYRQMSKLLRYLGLFHAYRTPWFLAVLAALLVNGLVCISQRLPALWRSLTRALVAVRPVTFYQGSARRAEWRVSSLEQAETAVCLGLRAPGRCYRLRLQRGNGGQSTNVAYVAAERGRWGVSGTAVSHLAIVALIAAVVAGPALRWQEAGITLVPAQTRTVGPDRSLIMEAGSLVEEFDAVGKVSGCHVPLMVAEAAPRHGDARPICRDVRIGKPLTYRGVSFHLQGSGPAVEVEFPAGTTRLPVSSGRSQEIVLAEVGLVLDVAYQPTEQQPRDDAGAPDGAVFFVEARGADRSLLGSGYVADGEEIVVQGVPLTFSLSRYTVWQVGHDPTFGLAVTAAGLLLVAVLVSLWVPHRRLWLRIETDRALMAGAGYSGPAFSALAAKLALACRPERGSTEDLEQDTDHEETFEEEFHG